jgi:SAM-dependent methyltransferase
VLVWPEKEVCFTAIRISNYGGNVSGGKTMLKDVFIGLSKNQFLTSAAKKYGLKLGAQTVVAGTNIEETIKSIRELNAHGISCTVDNLGEFVFEKEEALKAKESILEVIESIHENGVDAHISLKPTQIGLDIDYDFCYENLREIVDAASKYNMHINIDMEDGNMKWDLNDGIPLPDNSVGVIWASHIIEHLHDKHKIMTEIHRVLADGGWAFIQVPSTDGRGAWQDPTHVSFWNENCFWYYTRKNMADFIRNKTVKFQEFRLQTFWWENNIAITDAWLVAVKSDKRRPHQLSI